MEVFDFDSEEKKLDNANRAVGRVFEHYNEMLSTLDEKDITVLQLHYFLKKYDTIKNMTPKGSYWSPERIQRMLEGGLLILQEEASKIYPGVFDLDDVRNKVSNDMNTSGLNNLLDDLSIDVKNAYISGCDHLYTVLPISGIEELIPSSHRENQYLSSITNGVFSASIYDEILKYIGRAHANGMIANGNRIEYPTNPFGEITEDSIMLKEPVSIYLTDARESDPQFDFVIENGTPRFIFGGEWISKDKKLNCVETVADRLPISFIENNEVHVRENDQDIILESNSKKI